MSAHPSLKTAVQTRRPRGWGRALSSRRVRNLIAIDQVWEDHRDGWVWRVANVYRKDGRVELQTGGGFHAGGYSAWPTFAALGRYYRLLDGERR